MHRVDGSSSSSCRTCAAKLHTTGKCRSPSVSVTSLARRRTALSNGIAGATEIFPSGFLDQLRPHKVQLSLDTFKQGAHLGQVGLGDVTGDAPLALTRRYISIAARQ